VFSRRPPLLVVLAALLVLAGLSTLVRFSNVAPSTSSLSLGQGSDSTALYCTGLSGTTGPEVGHYSFLNTTSSTRMLNVEVVSDKNASSLVSIKLGPHHSSTLVPQSVTSGSSYAAAVQVNGGGVVGEEVTNSHAEAPCVSAGVTNWYASGFDTTVGSTAELSIYNPTATPAVFNISTYSPSGFAAPAPFQGLAVAAHQQTEINLGSEIVNTSNVATHVRVLRGSIVINGVEQSGPVTSFTQGQSVLSEVTRFPAVTTVNNAVAQIRVANPSGESVNVVAKVKVVGFSPAPQDLTVSPYASGEITITPNSAIPAAGYAIVSVRSSAPVATSLVTGTSAGTALSSPVTPSNQFVVADFAGVGYDAADVTNILNKTLKVTFTTIPNPGERSDTGSTELAQHSTESILSVFSGVSSLKGQTLLVTASSRSSLLVTLTLPSTPSGVSVVSPLDGG